MRGERDLLCASADIIVNTAAGTRPGASRHSRPHSSSLSRHRTRASKKPRHSTRLHGFFSPTERSGCGSGARLASRPRCRARVFSRARSLRLRGTRRTKREQNDEWPSCTTTDDETLTRGALQRPRDFISDWIHVRQTRHRALAAAEEPSHGPQHQRRALHHRGGAELGLTRRRQRLVRSQRAEASRGWGTTLSPKDVLNAT